MTRHEWAALARTFPTLLDAPGVRHDEEPDPLALDAWGSSEYAGNGARNSVRFILHLFDSRRAWDVGPLSLREAWGSWDPDHQAAFMAWARSPRFA